MFASAESASFWFNIWTGLGVLGAILVGVGAIGTWRAGVAKEGFASDRAKAAELAIEKQRTQTANANLKVEELKAQLAWRELTSGQAEALIKEGASEPGSVNIKYVSGDPESQMYALELSDALRRAGWQTGTTGFALAEPAFGLLVPDEEKTAHLRHVFTAAKLRVEKGSPATQGWVGFIPDNVQEAPVLFVGSKPRTPPSDLKEK
jgi:hypothetical protein